jgi:hypothetical protein
MVKYIFGNSIFDPTIFFEAPTKLIWTWFYSLLLKSMCIFFNDYFADIFIILLKVSEKEKEFKKNIIKCYNFSLLLSLFYKKKI